MRQRIRHRFVEFIPETIEPGILYISLEYSTTRHQCPCGCGTPVVAPLDPNRWSVEYNGRTVSMRPSIANLSFPCRSHYWIRNDEIVWSYGYDAEEAADVIRRNSRRLDRVDSRTRNS